MKAGLIPPQAVAPTVDQNPCRLRRFDLQAVLALQELDSALIEKERDYFDYRSVVTGYRSFPLVALFALLIAFFAISYTTNNNVLAGLAAAVPVFLLILRWVHLARQLDRCVCARCGQRLPEKIMWKYPPDNCPNCDHPLWAGSSKNF